MTANYLLIDTQDENMIKHLTLNMIQYSAFKRRWKYFAVVVIAKIRYLPICVRVQKFKTINIERRYKFYISMTRR